jgi:hypothetical protein
MRAKRIRKNEITGYISSPKKFSGLYLAITESYYDMGECPGYIGDVEIAGDSVGHNGVIKRVW